MREECDDELMVRLIERLILVARYRARRIRYPTEGSGFWKLEIRHRAVAAALMVKVLDREAERLASRSCPRCHRPWG